MKNLIAIKIIVVFLLGCSESQTSTDMSVENTGISLSETQLKSNNILTGQLKRMPVLNYVNATGYIDVPPNNRLDVFIPVNAYVEDVKVLPGDQVSKGQILVVLSHPEIITIQSNYIKLNLKAQQLRKELERKEELKGSMVVSEKEMLQLQTDYQVTEAELTGLKSTITTLGINIDKLKKGTIANKVYIRSKIEGKVSTLNVHRGKLIRPEEQLLTVINTEHKHLEVNLFPEIATKVQIGQKVLFTTSGSDRLYEGDVYLKNANFYDDNTLLAHCHIDNTNDELIVGDFAYVDIVLSQDSVYAIPNEEIISTGNRHYLFIKDEDGFQRQEVFPGKKDHQYTEIIGPESIFRNTIVLKGNYYLNGI